MDDIISTLEMMCTDEWITKHHIKNIPIVHDCRSVEVSDNIHFFMYRYCTPIIRFMSKKEDRFMELTYNANDNDAEIFTFGDGGVSINMDMSEEEFFQTSLIKNCGWLTYEMYYYGLLVCRKHFDMQGDKCLI